MDPAITIEDSDDEEVDPNIPSAEVCEERCQQFAEVTGTDSALAMFYLQDCEWILETALNNYFGGSASSTATPQSQSTVPPETNFSCSDALGESKQAKSTTFVLPASSSQLGKKTTGEGVSSQAPCLTTKPPVLQPKNESRIRVLSWNIDGLDPDNIKSRAEGACGVLLQDRPEAIFLQEVVEKNKLIIESQMDQYHMFWGKDQDLPLSMQAYFTAVLLRKDCTTIKSVNVADFPNSLMGRNLLEVQCTVKGQELTLLTSHLESTKDHSEERLKQLQTALSRMKAQPDDRTVIFGGDTNLRDSELKKASKTSPILSGIYDMWECTGKRPEASYTWDLLRNDNKQMGGKFQPRLRFDRLYIKHRSGKPAVKPVYFELVGIQRLASCHRFPSDHWGILAHMDIKS